jgi:hypothetical protein
LYRKTSHFEIAENRDTIRLLNVVFCTEVAEKSY